MTELFEKIEHNGKILALIVRAAHIDQLQASGEPMAFITPDEFPLQIGIHNRPEGEILKPHFHLPFPELKDFPVQEFFYVIKGSVQIDLYDDQQGDAKVKEIIINTGDSVVLNTGHGFTFLAPSQLIELKQGPYRGRENEKRFIVGGNSAQEQGGQQ